MKKILIAALAIALLIPTVGCLRQAPVTDEPKENTQSVVTPVDYDWTPKDGEKTQDVIDRVKAAIEADFKAGKKIVLDFSSLNKPETDDVYKLCTYCIQQATATGYNLKDQYTVEGAAEIAEAMKIRDSVFQDIRGEGEPLYKRMHTDEELEPLIKAATDVHIAVISVLQYDEEKNLLTVDPSVMDQLLQCLKDNAINEGYISEYNAFYDYSVGIVETLSACILFGSECKVNWVPLDVNRMMEVTMDLCLTGDSNDAGRIVTPLMM